MLLQFKHKLAIHFTIFQSKYIEKMAERYNVVLPEHPKLLPTPLPYSTRLEPAEQDEERCELVEEDDGRVVCRCAFGTRMKCPVSFALQRLQPASLSLSDTFRLHRRNVERRRQRIVSLMLRNKLVAPGGFVTSVKLLGLMLWILVNVIKTSVLDTLKFVAFDWVRVMFRAFTRKQTDA